MPIEFEIPTLRIQIQERLPEHASRLLPAEHPLTLDEDCLASGCRLEREQLRRKAFVDCHAQKDRTMLKAGSPVLVFVTCLGLMLGKLKLR